MLNMIRMELYRMFKTKSLYVIWLVLAAGILFTTGLSADEMKTYTITVNGTAYDVTVEENGAGAAPVARPAAAPKAAPAAAPAAPKAAPAGGAGSIEVKAGAAGKVFKIEANVGQAVKKGDAVVIIEAMKMEIPVVAPEDGTVASIDVAVGDAIDSGAVLATLN